MKTITRLGRNLRPGDVIIGDAHSLWELDSHCRVDTWPADTNIRMHDWENPDHDERMRYRPTVLVSTTQINFPNRRSPMHWFLADVPYTIRRTTT